MLDLSFYKGKKVFLTGHTGFKGSWMCSLLSYLEAEVTGYALEPPEDNDLFDLMMPLPGVKSIIGDIRDLPHLQEAINEAQPEIVIHMAAMPIVRESYKIPVYTYETNVMGTVNLLEAVRHCDSVKSVINVTTDKVYKNKERAEGYTEDEELNGYDPYANSKSCSELVTSSYINSFLHEKGVAVTTCRAGNVVGGGDLAIDRIIPDCYRAAVAKKNVVIRNPYSIRPFQHVLEPICAYLYIAMKQYDGYNYQGAYNIGPNEEDCVTTSKLVDLFCLSWKAHTNDELKWDSCSVEGPHESGYLKLDVSKVKKQFGWKPIWNVEKCIDKTAEWYACMYNKGDLKSCTKKQIEEYLSEQTVAYE